MVRKYVVVVLFCLDVANAALLPTVRAHLPPSNFGFSSLVGAFLLVLQLNSLLLATSSDDGDHVYGAYSFREADTEAMSFDYTIHVSTSNSGGSSAALLLSFSDVVAVIVFFMLSFIVLVICWGANCIFPLVLFVSHDCENATGELQRAAQRAPVYQPDEHGDLEASDRGRFPQHLHEPTSHAE